MLLQLEELDRELLSMFDSVLLYGYKPEYSPVLEYMLLQGVDGAKIELCLRPMQLWDYVKEKPRTLVVAIISTWNEETVIKNACASQNTCTLVLITGADYTPRVINMTLAEFEQRHAAYADAGNTYQENKDFSSFSPKVKALAYYLPQFHETKENNEWWGEGFTEWTNTKKSLPRFAGHYQPRTPHDDIGYYDLSDVETLRCQATLAKEHGIYGFCVYYYWFSGRRILEKPIDLLLRHPEIDFPFCFLWANENWTRTWADKDDVVLLSQNYRDEDPELFIDDLKKYFDDERYIRHDGKPILQVYRLAQIPNVRNVIARWRNRAREIGIGELYIIGTDWLDNIDTLNISDALDAKAFFGFYHNHIEFSKFLVANTFWAYDYGDHAKKAMTHIKTRSDDLTTYHATLLNWDNAPRYNQVFASLDFRFSFRAFYEWLRVIADDAVENEKAFMFINAWNEWAESSCLEPDARYGYAALNTVARALCGLPFDG